MVSVIHSAPVKNYRGISITHPVVHYITAPTPVRDVKKKKPHVLNLKVRRPRVNHHVKITQEILSSRVHLSKHIHHLKSQLMKGIGRP